MSPLVISDNEQLETDRKIIRIELSEDGEALVIHFEKMAHGLYHPTITAPVMEGVIEELKRPG